jgi:Arm DNA-binding domain
MARTTGRLTALKVSRARLPGMYADGGGLYLQVTEGGASWIYRYMLAGRAREMGLGPLALFGLSEARAKALDARRLRHERIDPIEARRAARAQERLEVAKASRSSNVPRATLTRIARAGIMPSMPRNGKRPSPPMPSRSSVRCQCKRSTRPLC